MQSELSGPDFLDSVADVEAGNGLPINANEYRKRARQWRELERTANANAAEIARLELDLHALRARAVNAAAALSLS